MRLDLLAVGFTAGVEPFCFCVQPQNQFFNRHKKRRIK